MLNKLQGWIVDNTISKDNKNDKILLLKPAGNVGLDKIYQQMLDEDTGLRIETITHVVKLFLRVVARLILNGYNVNTGLFRAYAQAKGLIEGGKWDSLKNYIYVAFIQDKTIREGIAETDIEILGTRPDVMYILEVEDRKTRSKDGTVTPGHNIFVRGALIKVDGDNAACGVSLTNESGAVTAIDPDDIVTNMPSELNLLLPTDLADGDYTLTITTQHTSGKLLKEPRSVSTIITVGGGGGDERPGEL